MMSARPPYAAMGSPPPTILPIVVRSGLMPYSCCAPPNDEPESSHHLIEDQQRAVLLRHPSHAFEEAGPGRNASHVADNGLDDHAGNPVTLLPKRLSTASRSLYGTTIVVAAKLSGTPTVSEIAKRRHARSGLHQQRIHMAVIAALELHREVAAGEPASHSQSTHRRLGTRVHQSHHLHRRHRRAG